MLPTKKVLIALAASVFLMGCSSKEVSIIGDKRVDIVQHKSIKEGKFLKVIADLENDDFDEVEGFVYRIEWFDENGVLKDTTGWKPIVIHKNQKVQIVEMSNLPEVTTYKLVVSVPEKL